MENKKNIRTAGLLFILVMVFYMTGSTMLTGQSTIATTTIGTGGLLLIANSISVMAIAALLYPSLSAYSKPAAVVYLAARITEGIMLMIGMIFLLLPHYITPDASTPTEQFTAITQKINYLMYQSGMLSLGIGGIVCSWLLYKRRLIAAWLSLWGIIGYALLCTGSIAELFGYPYGIMLSMPGGLFELVFGIRLIAKGFQTIAVPATSC